MNLFVNRILNRLGFLRQGAALTLMAMAPVTLESLRDKAEIFGKWEVRSYSEQGIQVNKRLNADSQAVKVYQHIKSQRALSWYGYDETLGERKPRTFESWQEKDSLREVKRLRDAIATPYYAVFFADSTLSVYNKDAKTQLVSLPEVYHYEFNPAEMSLPILNGRKGYPRWRAQVVSLSATRMTLFLPEDGEVVELVKAEYVLP